MDITLIYPKFPLGKDKWVVAGGSNRMYPPLDMGWIAKLLKEDNIHFRIIDANANRYTKKDLYKKLSGDIFVLTSDPYEGYRCMNLGDKYVNVHKEYIKLIKSIDKNNICILIGPHGTALPDYIFMENPGLDFIVRGEPELTCYKLLKCLVEGLDFRQIGGISYRENGRIKHNKPADYINDLDWLSHPAFEYLEMEKYLKYHEKKDKVRKMIVLSSRGCPFQCIYCFKSIYGNSFRARSVNNVMKEIKILYEEHGVEHVSFIDDIFTLDKKRVELLCKKWKYPVSWDCETRVDTISKSLINSMAKAGCTEILFGVETFIPRIQRNICKIVDINKVKDLVEYAQSKGIYVTVALQFGLPGDSWETINKNLEIIKKLDIPVGLPLITRVYPQTRLYELAVKRGLISDGSFKECIELSGMIDTDFENREEYYDALHYYHKKIKQMNLRKKFDIQYITKKIRRYGLVETVKRGIKRLVEVV